MRLYLIAVDGPAGAGKSTVSRMLAKKMNYRYLDTGALYRAVALRAILQGLDGASVEKEKDLIDLCRDLDLRFVRKQGENRLILQGRDVTEKIRSPEVSMMASRLAAKPAVRNSLLGLQREIGKEKGLVAEGRDMGTVVFPDADVKFFLDASVQERALRRFRELDAKCEQTYEQVRKEIQQRDQKDSTRSLAPLTPAPDAVIIDSTRLSVEQVVKRMMEHISEKNGK